MKNTIIPTLVAVLLTTSAPIVSAVPAAADDQMASMDCSQAEAMLEKAVSQKVPSMMTGDVDKDFATIMMVHEKVGQRIYQIEAKCGKNAKMQSMAAKQAEGSEQRMDEFRNLGMSQ